MDTSTINYHYEFNIEESSWTLADNYCNFRPFTLTADYPHQLILAKRRNNFHPCQCLVYTRADNYIFIPFH